MRKAVRTLLAAVHLTLLITALFLCLADKQAIAADPIAIEDDFATISDQTVTGLLSDNDQNLDGPTDTYAKLSDPANGIASVNSDGSFSYTPNISFVGNDSFTYSIDDGAGGSSSALVNLNISTNTDLISSTNAILSGGEDTEFDLGLQVAPAVYNGGEMQDLLSTDIAFRDNLAGNTPLVSTIPAGATSIVITGFSTQSVDTSQDNDLNDDYQLLNVRINLIDGTSSGRVALITAGGLSALDQYAWVDAPLGQSVLTDLTKVEGFYATGETDPAFSVVGDALQIVETHLLDSAYIIEYMTSDGDSANFLSAGNSVQAVGVSSSILALPTELEPASGKKGFVALNASSAAAGSDSSTESKGFARLLLDFESLTISGSIAAQSGEGSDNTVTYSFEGYQLIDKRVSTDTPASVLLSTATIVGDTTASSDVIQNPTLYIDTSGQLVIERASDFATTFSTMYTAEFYERTGLGSVASFVSSSSADAFFDDSPPDGLDEFGEPIDKFDFMVPASARIGLLQMSWSTIGGSAVNENIGMGFALIDLERGTSSGSLTFIRTSTPDLLSWSEVPFGSSFFGATNGGGDVLYVSNKTAGNFTDAFGETAALLLATNPDGSRTLTFSATSSAGTGNTWEDYRGNATISWLGNEPVSISSVPTAGVFSHGAADGNGGWEIDIAELPLLKYQPPAHVSGTVPLPFQLYSTGETENLELRIAPRVDSPVLAPIDAVGYVDTAFAIDIPVTDSADTDGSETQPATLALTNVPAAITLSSTTGVVTDLGSGAWTADRASLAALIANASGVVSTSNITVSVSQIDEFDVDGDSFIEDGDNGSGIDEYDDLLVSDTFSIRVQELPTVTSLLTNSGTPVIGGTGTPSIGETLTVTVNGIVYVDSGPDLVVNGDGSWTLTIPPANTLTDNTYAVVVELAHSSGSSGIDTSNDELVVDLTPPPQPSVTKLSTTDTTPVIEGTATITTGDIFRVEVNSIVYVAGDGDLTINGNGTWTLTIPPSNVLAENSYDVTATLTDEALNTTSDPSSNELKIDLTAPASPTVTAQLTNSSTPTLAGTATIAADENLSVTVNAVSYVAGDGNLTDNGDATWTLVIPVGSELPEGTLDVSVTVTDAAGNSASDTSTNEIELDLTSPQQPGVTNQISNTATPIVAGTATLATGETLGVLINGVTYVVGDGNLVDNADGTWSLAIPPSNSLAEASYEVIATVTDAAQNASTDPTSNELTIDLTAPVVPTVTAQQTNSTTPTLSGTATVGTGEVLSVTVNAVSYVAGDGNLTDNGDGTWTLVIPVGNELPEGVLDVSATVTDAASNASTDASSNELTIDLTAPVVPTFTAQQTNSTTPTLSGTATMATGEVLSVAVNGVSYVAGDGNLIDNGDGTWILAIPVGNELPEGVLDVSATVTDAASNASTDASSNELTIDLTAPIVPTITAQQTNSTTPILSGTATVASGEVLSVAVNGVSYAVGDGNLTDNGDATWTLVIPVGSELPEGTLDVSVTVTDAAGNSASDTSTNEIELDLTSPQQPGVTNQISNTATPIVAGTATLATGETLGVLINGVTYVVGDGNLVDNADGTWSLAIPPSNSLAEASYEVIATVTDAAQNASTDPTSNELTIDLTAPVVPTITAQQTNSTTPTLSGMATVGTGEVLSVTVNAVSYVAGDGNLTDNGDATWTLVIPVGSELPEGVLDVSATVTDAASNASTDASSNELTIDLTAPVVPTFTAQQTNSTTPTLSGTATMATGEVLSVAVNGVSYVAGDGNLTDNGDGTWILAIPVGDELPEGVQDVSVTISDAASNTSTDASSNELTIDLTAPIVPTITAQQTNSTTPILSGTATVASGEVLSVAVNGVSYAVGDGNLTDNGDATWTLVIPVGSELPEGTLDVSVSVTDAAGNSASDTSTNEIEVDLTSPQQPGVTSQISNTATPIVAGTATLATGETLGVLINGVTYVVGDGNLVDNADGTWSLAIPPSNSLAEASYEVIATVTDAAQNASTDPTSNELTIDLTAPVVPTVTAQQTNSTTPTLSGTATVGTGEVLSVAVNGVSYAVGDGNLTDNGDATWTLVIPVGSELPEGTLDVSITVTDAAGNSASDTSTNEIEVDLTSPQQPGVTSQISNTATPIVAGTATLATGETLGVLINGVTYVVGDGNLVDNADGTWSLAIPPSNSLAEASYEVIATVTDAAQNASTDPTSNELTIDLTAPVVPTVTAQQTNSTTPTLSGTATVETGEVLSMAVNGVSYVAGDGNLTDNGDGTWTLVIPVGNELPEGFFNVIVSITDHAGNSSSDASINEIEVDLTSPQLPSVTSQIINNTTPVITGTAVLATDETLSVMVNGITYVAGDGDLVDNTDGSWSLTIPPSNALPEASYEVMAMVTDAALNTSIDPGSQELSIDLTPPVVPTVTAQVTNSATPTVSGTATLATGEILSMIINGVAYVVGDGNLIDNGDDTWTLITPTDNALSEGTFDVRVTVTDAAGNSASDVSNSEIDIDLTAPQMPEVMSLITNTGTPVIHGTAALVPDETLSVMVNGINYVAGGSELHTNSNGTWTLTIPPSNSLAQGLYDVTATVTDTALNSSMDPSNGELFIDLTPPAAPTVNTVLTNVLVPTLSGTAEVAAGEIFTVIVNGVLYTVGEEIQLATAENTWHLNIPADADLTDATYDVNATTTDASGNSVTDTSAGELIIDLYPPTTPTINAQQTNSSMPTLGGTTSSALGETLSVVVNGQTYTQGDGNLLVNSDGIWTLGIPTEYALADGSYVVMANTRDMAGNQSAGAEQLLQVDTVAPLLSATAPQQATTYRPLLRGNTDTPNGSIVRVLDSTANLVCQATVTDSFWNCVPIVDLPDGQSELSVSTTDAAGNAQMLTVLVSLASDFDADGIPNSIEGSGDFDNDGLSNHTDPDSDNDGLTDQREGDVDTDQDGLSDYLDEDADNDGIPDIVEALGGDVDFQGNILFDPLQSSPTQILDTDYDGIADFLDVDSDQDGIPDIVETFGNDADNDGRVDGFTDRNANGLDDGMEVLHAQILDSDNDGLPDYRDLDSDNDGISDIVEAGGTDVDEDGIVDTAKDNNSNGIPDSVDAHYTQGDDIDNDGIDDLADASFITGDDSDGDGIVDVSDPDSDGDGRADTASFDLAPASALPDSNLDGTPDFQQSGDGALRTGVSGRGGCSITQSPDPIRDPLLFLFICLSLIEIVLRSGRLKNREHEKKIAPMIARHAQLPIAFLLVLATPFSSAQSLYIQPYAGFGLGQSYLEPDSLEVMIELTDNTDRSISAVLGVELTRRLAVELTFDDLGQARFSDDVHMDYRIRSASLLYRAYHYPSQSKYNQGLSLYGRVGTALMDNRSNFSYIRDHNTSLSFGGGVDYRFKNGMALRIDAASFDTDAHRVGLFLLYRPFGRDDDETKRQLNVKVPATAQTNAPMAEIADAQEMQDSDDDAPPALSESPTNDKITHTIVFDLDSSFLDRQARITIARVAVHLNNTPAQKIHLTGYANDSGNADYNHRLANNRINKIITALALAGVDSARISSTVAGGTNRLGSLKLHATPRANRRVDMLVLPALH